METFLKDLKQSLRMFRQNPGFTLTAVAALTLGIGANTAIFSVINTVLLKPVDFPDPDRLVLFQLTSPQGSKTGASATKFNLWREQTEVFQDVSAYRTGALNLTGGDNPEQIASAQVSADYFRLFGAPVEQGRTFTPEEDRPGGPKVAVLSDGLWRRHFGADPQIVGKTISLGGAPYEVIGIIGAGFRIEVEQPPEVWTPFQIDPNSTDQAHYFSGAGRLKPGVTLAMAKARLKAAAEEFKRRYPKAMDPEDSFSAEPIREALVRNVKSSLWVLLGAVSLVLLIACANVANLLLARAAGRSREIAIRAAIGAGRGRILRQLLTESVVLAMAGGILGLILGMVEIRVLLAVNPGNIPRVLHNGSTVQLDWRILAFTLLISLATGVLFGLFPAFQGSRADLSATLKERGGRSGSGLRQNKARAVLVVSEMALALVLLVFAALMIRTYVALRSVNPGFNPHNVLTMRMSLTGPRFEKTAGVAQLVRDGTQRLSALPGVEVASSTCCVPLQGGYGLPFIVVGRPLDGPSHGVGSWSPVAPGYFEVFKIPIVRGRTFTDRDGGGAPGVVIINEAMVRKNWPQGDPLGDQLIIGKGVGPEFDEPARQIIGVAGDTRDGGLNADPQPAMYIPAAQIADGVNALNVRISPLAWVVRTRVEPYSLSQAIQRELREASGGLPVARVRTMDEIVSGSTAREDFNMLLLTVFAGTALVLAAIGIYGLMAYSVEQRTQEIGIRMALGAAAGAVRNMIIRQGMMLALAGVAIGVGAAFGLTRVIEKFLFGVKTWDPFVFVCVPVVLSVVALAAVWIPASRATRIDPVEALRCE